MHRGILAAVASSIVAVGMGYAAASSMGSGSFQDSQANPSDVPPSTLETVVEERSVQAPLDTAPVRNTEELLQLASADGNADPSADLINAEPSLQQVNSETESDPALEAAILQTIPEADLCSASETLSEIRYFHNYADLNGDGRSEAIAYLVGSYTCGTGGCTTLIFEDQGSEYTLNSYLTLVNPPVIVSDQTTNGWQDLILYVTGGGADSGYYQLQHDGQSYPSNPSIEPALNNQAIAGTAFLADDITADTTAPTLPLNCSAQ